MTKLQKSLGLFLLAATAAPAAAQIAPLDLAGIQSQSQNIIQQQNIGSQLNSLRLNQNITQDRIREMELFRPHQSFGAASLFQPPDAYVPGPAFQPQPSGLAPLPPQNAPQSPAPAPAPK
jgi:hypothetical protein